MKPILIHQFVYVSNESLCCVLWEQSKITPENIKKKLYVRFTLVVLRVMLDCCACTLNCPKNEGFGIILH